MSATYKKHLYVLCLIIIVQNIIIVQCQIFIDNDPDVMSGVQDPLLEFQSVQFAMDGSGETSKLCRLMFEGKFKASF